ncbi:branched-chain amino acid ABC transporter permease [Ottowia oryzae]|uniref:Branched-chain amino acid ABC transporter permease n=1 Tax=Ottowia oryzae TaxID=2109914 RepID=A0A2S0MG94_9BURK|nr:branched-chain amino acid ABC transporter permease [Ottowia oryzae]AVO34846.1 branched-chain amino acid ABC transporter permease [Ottowia oryzae]
MNTAATSTVAPPRMPLGRVLIWGAFALVLIVAPLVFTSNLGVTMLAQMGIAIIACLSYNILLGQGGMLSFGHAVYSGLGAYVAIHTLNAVSAGRFYLPVSLIPLVGGLAGVFFAALFGYVTTKKSGTTFAMITLGIAELVFAMSLMIPEFFGGEAGVSGNRVVGEPVLGITFGPARQLYYLIAIYTFVSVALMFAFTQTPLGRMLNAVRDNPERVEFIGYSSQRVRYYGFIVAGFFAGIAGGLGALQFELVTAEVVGPVRSGSYLLFTFLGGATVFFGPIIGGILMVLATVLLSELTKAWLLYLGLIFVFMVMYAPGGIASLIMMNVRVAQFGRLGRVAPSLAVMLVSGIVMLAGAGAMIEMIYHLQLNSAMGDEVPFAGVTLHARSAMSWGVSAVLLAVGAFVLDRARRRYAEQWGEVQSEIENAARKSEGSAP